MDKLIGMLRRVQPLARASGPAEQKPARRLSVRSKFLLMLLLTSLLSLGTITWLAYQSGKKALTDAAVNQLTSLRVAKKQQVEHFFQSLRDSFRVLASAPIVSDSIVDLTAAYGQLGKQRLSPERDAKLEKFYKDAFLPKLAQNSDSDVQLDQFWPASPATQEVQALYLSENPNPEGQKTLLVRHPVVNDYTRAHERYHRWFQAVTANLHFYDVFLIDAETTNIVYSVAKEADLGANLTNGPFAGTNLAHLVRDVIRSRQPGDARIVDFAFYPPSHNAPSAFIAAPVFKDQVLVGVIAAQISIDAVGKLMNGGRNWREQGLGETGDTYLVGADLMLRSNNRPFLENPKTSGEIAVKNGVVTAKLAERMRQQSTNVLRYPIRVEPVRQALLGRSGTDLIVNQRGVNAFVSYAPLDLPDLRWVIIARMSETEVLASQIKFNRDVMISACILALLATLAALWLARMFLKPVQALVEGIERLRRGERSVSVASRTHDEFDDVVGAFNEMSSTIQSRDQVIQAKSQAYEQLLKRIFPEAIAMRMKDGEATISETFQQVTVIYAIIEGLSTLEGEHGGQGSIKLLNEIVDRFDSVAEHVGVEKVKTIGDHYLAVAGLSVTRLDHARRGLEFARLAWRELVLVNQANGLDLGLRMGVATGTTHAGLVGSRRFVYDIWGQAPSTARRIVYDADVNAVRINAEAAAQLPDRSGMGEELAVKTKTMGVIQTSQLRFEPMSMAKAAE